jgi:biopolymer transport protein ExbD
MAGIRDKKKPRIQSEIPTSSMADIAFLLLIFFLITTTIDVDTGIGMTLPPPLEEDQPPPEVRERNMLRILVNAQGQVLMEGEPSAIRYVRETVKTHVLNNGEDPNYSESPERAIVSIKVDRQTPYSIYIDVLDEVWMAYREMWDAEARALGYPDYFTYRSRLGDRENVIRDRIKANVSLAEPDPGS